MKKTILKMTEYNELADSFIASGMNDEQVTLAMANFKMKQPKLNELIPSEYQAEVDLLHLYKFTEYINGIPTKLQIHVVVKNIS